MIGLGFQIPALSISAVIKVIYFPFNWNIFRLLGQKDFFEFSYISIAYTVAKCNDKHCNILQFVDHFSCRKEQVYLRVYKTGSDLIVDGYSG